MYDVQNEKVTMNVKRKGSIDFTMKKKSNDKMKALEYK